MKKEDFISMGIDPELAEKAANASIEELKGYIPKNRFDEVNSRVKALETDVKSRDDQLEQLKKVDADALQQTIKDLQQQNKNMQTQHESEKKQIKFDSALDLALSGAKAKLPKAVKALLELDSEKAEFAEDGTITGLSDQIKKLTENDGTKFLFENTEAAHGLRGAKPAEGKDGAPQSSDPSKMNYAELCKFMDEHPETTL